MGIPYSLIFQIASEVSSSILTTFMVILSICIYMCACVCLYMYFAIPFSGFQDTEPQLWEL